MKKIKRFLKYLNGQLQYVLGRDEFTLSRDWDQFWSREKQQFRNRFNRVAESLPKKSQSLRVAEIGAGGGELLDYLYGTGRISKDSLGIDSSLASVQRIEKLGFKGVQADVSSAAFKLPESYDIAIMCEVVEHIRDVEVVLESIKHQVKYGIIITTPNVGYLWFRLRLLFGRFPHIVGLPPREHIRFWTVSDFKIWSNQLGFKVKKVDGCSGFPILYKYFPALFSYDVLYWIEASK